ncbi:trace amine-associated receptor 1-like [Stylophora pistillata]|uniref:trace amine-associated receptor 1-like n=1 Tax=Stylophora pistillata TaxID=50429 RepID=UPI000C043601|nr:trace amine-associated receptor 1-like [Stylophora pistillata]
MACYDLSLTFIRAFTAICWTSGLLAFAENLTVILTVRYIRSLRPTARYFMASLAAAELLSGITANLYFVRNYARTEDAFLKMETAVWFFTTTSVTFSLSNVAVDRFVAITSPLHYHAKMTLNRCIIMIMLSWFLALMGVFAALLIPIKHLVKLWTSGGIISLFIPFCIIVFCYYKIYKVTRNTFPVHENVTDAQQMAENRRQRKTACTFGIITGLFIVLFMPSFLISMIPVTNEVNIVKAKCDGFRRKFWLAFSDISYFSAVIDPWVYVIRMPDFRGALKELFQRMCRVLSLPLNDSSLMRHWPVAESESHLTINSCLIYSVTILLQLIPVFNSLLYSLNKIILILKVHTIMFITE